MKKVGKLVIAKTEDLVYLANLKKFIFVSAIVFFLSAIYGFFFVSLHPGSAQEFISAFRELSQKIVGLRQHELILLIFINNSAKIIILTVLGVLFGVAPVVFLAFNGFLLGVVAFIAQSENSWLSLALGILPHGLLEIPILIIAGAIGLKLGVVFIQSLKEQKNIIRQEFTKSLKFLGAILIPLLLFTAFIEVFITKSLIYLI